MKLFFLKDIKAAWKSAYSSNFIIAIFIVIVIALFLIINLPAFFNYIQNRRGMLLEDKLLEILPSFDLSWVIFPIIQLSIILGILQLLNYPDVLITGIIAYLLVTILRMLCIYLVPLEPPQGLVLLNDPLNEALFYGQRVITKDLFFSGHISTISILFLTAQNKTAKKIFFFLIFILALMILIQHVHYTIDVIAAPIFTWLSYKISSKAFYKLL
jgi:hypothetical protein